MPTSTDVEVIIVGAGIAGLAAARELTKAGLSVCNLEARERIGGRIFYAHDPACDVEIPLGAEFIHGKPKEIWEPLHRAGVKIDEMEGDIWCVADGRLSSCDFFGEVDAILGKMDDNEPDQSFDDFLACFPAKNAAEQGAQKRACQYVSGFNAAETSKVGVHWLVQEIREEERIEADRIFRPDGGYGQLVRIFGRSLPAGVIRTSSKVTRISWRHGSVEVAFTDLSGESLLRSKRVVVTIPLGVLKAPLGQTGTIEFDPPLPERYSEALGHLEMGKVLRVTLRFQERFWEDLTVLEGSKRKSLANLGFLLTDNEVVPTWWTTVPERLPIITGWAPVHAAERLSGRNADFVVESCLRSLGESLHVAAERLRGMLGRAYLHDWEYDCFSRGAYSYGKVGAIEAASVLGEPIDGVMFLAGEHTDSSGNGGTVNGAIASGYRAAGQILAIE